MQLAGPSAAIDVHIDPQTLCLIFEYVAALIAIYKSADYFGEFFKACSKKLGEMTGAKIAEIISILWQQLHKRVSEIQKKVRDPRIYFSLEVDINGKHISANNAMFLSHIDKMSENDVAQAFNLLIFKVLPISKEFITQSNIHGLALKEVRADLYYSRAAFGLGSWYWRLEIWPIGAFSLDPQGTLRAIYPLKGFKLRFLKMRRFLQREVRYDDIQEIVKKCK
jgi:hypothetical protein